MESVEVRKLLDGRYAVTGYADTLPEAMRATDVLLAIPTEAFEVARDAVYVAPGTFGPGKVGDNLPLRPIPEMPAAMEALADRLEASEHPEASLNFDKPLGVES